jgi:hypothetical protein
MPICPAGMRISQNSSHPCGAVGDGAEMHGAGSADIEVVGLLHKFQNPIFQKFMIEDYKTLRTNTKSKPKRLI